MYSFYPHHLPMGFFYFVHNQIILCQLYASLSAQTVLVVASDSFVFPSEEEQLSPLCPKPSGSGRKKRLSQMDGCRRVSRHGRL